MFCLMSDSVTVALVQFHTLKNWMICAYVSGTRLIFDEHMHI